MRGIAIALLLVSGDPASSGDAVPLVERLAAASSAVTPSAAPVVAPAADPSERAALVFAEACRLLGQKDIDKARSTALSGLSLAPYQIDGFRVLADVARAAGEGEELLRWRKWEYWSHQYSGRAKEAATVGEELAGLYVGWNRDEALLADWRASVEKAIKYAGGAGKLFGTAGHMMGKLRALNPSDAELAKQFDKLYEKAGEAVSGGAFTAARVRSRSPKWIQRQNEEHAAWENAFERKTAHYRIITNISYEFFETVSVVMEDMFDFYQETCNYSGRAPTVTLAIHRRRSDFDRFCQQELGGSGPLNMGGWFYDEAMTVAAYDRTEEGTDLSDLWRVLFHEASHQFTYLLTTKKTKQKPPRWLHEGTASFFEGCELKSDGSIVKNKPALNRLREWESLDGSPRGHTLEEVVKCPFANYDGSYYSYGWGFVYFLNNYQDAEGNLVYRQPYLNYFDSYTKKSKNERDEHAYIQESYDRAVKYLVDDVGDPGVPDWSALEDRWRKYMLNLVKEWRSGSELAGTLQERCRAFLNRKDYERAMILAEQADDKRAGDPETHRLLALSCAGLKRDADAVYWMLRRWEVCWARGDDADALEAEAWLAKNGAKEVAEGYCAASRKALEGILAAADVAEQEGRPAAAMLYLCHALRAFGVDQKALMERTAELRDGSGVDLTLWRSGFLKDRTSNRKWDGVDVVRYDSDGVLVNNPEGFGSPRAYTDVADLSRVSPPFSVRGVVEVDGELGGFLYLGITPEGTVSCAINFLESGWVELENIDLETDVASGFSLSRNRVVKTEKLEVEKKLPFRLEVTTTGGQLYLGEGEAQKVIELPDDWPVERLTGAVALSAGDDSVALFSQVEIRTGRPFWPVRPADIE